MSYIGKVDQEDPKRFESFHKTVTPAASFPSPATRAGIFLWSPRIDSKERFRQAVWYNNPISTRFLAPMDC
jgi:hypothetical protein